MRDNEINYHNLRTEFVIDSLETFLYDKMIRINFGLLASLRGTKATRTLLGKNGKQILSFLIRNSWQSIPLR